MSKYTPGRYTAPPIGPFTTNSATTTTTATTSAYAAIMAAETGQVIESTDTTHTSPSESSTNDAADHPDPTDPTDPTDLIALQRKETAELARQCLEDDTDEEEEEEEKWTQDQEDHPDGEWVAYIDEASGQSYYYNTRTGATTWEEPDDYNYGAAEDKYAAVRSQVNWAKLKGMVRGRPGAPSKFHSTSATRKRKQSTQNLESYGLLDGLGVDYLETKWKPPTVDAAEVFRKNNTFDNGGGSLCGTQIQEFGLVSVGVRAMFELYQYLGGILVVAFILTLPVLVLYSNGRGSQNVFDITTLSSWSAASSGLQGDEYIASNGTTSSNSDVSTVKVDFFLGTKITVVQASELISLCDFVTSVFLVVSFVWIRQKLSQIKKLVNHDCLSAVSFTIMVGAGLPAKVSELELAEHFSSLYALDTIDFRLRKKQCVLNSETAMLNAAKNDRQTANSQVHVIKQSSSGEVREIEVTVPKNKNPGERFTIDLPDGKTVQCTVPPGLRPGFSFIVHADAKQKKTKKQKSSSSSKYGVNETEDGMSNLWEPNESKTSQLLKKMKDFSHHPGAEKYKEHGWVADVVLVRDEGDVIRRYQKLAEIDGKVRLHRAKIKRVSPGTVYTFGEDSAQAENLTLELSKLEYEQQQGLMSIHDDKDEQDVPVVKAFITFTHEESFNRAVSDYALAWRRSSCFGTAPELLFKGKLLHVVPAPEPADVLFENQGEYKKPCFHELRLLASIGIVVMVLALSLTTVILVHISKESVTPNRDTEQL